MPAPHRVMDEVVRGLAKSVDRLGDSVHAAVTGAGEDVMKALDKPFTDITGKVGPHRMVDSAARGVADAARNAVSTGAMGSLKMVGEGMMKALDNPVEQTGLPPKDIGRIGGR